MKKSFLFFLMLVNVYSYAQERCGFAFGEKERAKNTSWLRQKAEFEYRLRENQTELNGINARVAAKIYKIPVVVHVIHNNPAGVLGGTNNANITDEQIKSQIRVLNEDYRKKVSTNGFNTNAVGADMEIEFELATKDPNGVASTGITRTFVNQTSWDFLGSNQTIANKIHWDFERYLNIWVLRSDGRTIGYSAFPYDSKLTGLGATTQDIKDQDIFDGVIIDYRNFGTCCGVTGTTYNLGRTTTHEVGHWLGLLHTNGDETCGTDYCSDTPQIESLNLSTNCNVLTSTCSGTKRTNMIENYMDYSPDRCMNIFTNDQKSRTRSALDLSVKRKKLLNSIEALPETDALTISTEPNPILNSASAFIKTQFKGEKNVVISVFDFRGVMMYEESYASQKSAFLTLKTDKLNSGEYIVRVRAGEEVISQKIFFQR